MQTSTRMAPDKAQTIECRQCERPAMSTGWFGAILMVNHDGGRYAFCSSNCLTQWAEKTGVDTGVVEADIEPNP